MGILNIREVKRVGSKVLIAICGTSGSGKTLTALKIANGMVSNSKKIGFLDTENQRGSLYSDALCTPFLIADLYAPFSPKRYAEAIKEFEDAGVEVLVIDSVSHEWFGDGGCEDIAYQAIVNGKKMEDWKKAKSEHKKHFMQALLYSKIHIICCVRAQEKTDFTNPSQPKSLGIQPICEKSFMFEMTASIMMYNQGTKQEFIKVPNFLIPHFGTGSGYLGEKTGKGILDWVNLGEKESQELVDFKQKMLVIAEKGIDVLKESWANGIKTLSKAEISQVNKEFHVYKAIAEESTTLEESTPDKLGDLMQLFELKKESLTKEQLDSVVLIINNNDESKFDKAINLLKSC